jgi:hypothetical protein
LTQSRRQRLLRTFLPIAIAAAIPLTIIWVFGPFIRNAAEFQMDIARTNPLLDAPPFGYGSPEPVAIGLDVSLTNFQTFDFQNRNAIEADNSTSAHALMNVVWAETEHYDALRIEVGDAAASLTADPDEWKWLTDTLTRERTVLVWAKTSAFASGETVIDTMAAMRWDGIVAGEYDAAALEPVVNRARETETALQTGFDTYYGGRNEFSVGFAWEQYPTPGRLCLDARPVSSADPGAIRNLLFLLTVQFKPAGVFTHMLTAEDHYVWMMNTVKPDLRNWHTYLRGEAGTRPVANVLFDAAYLEPNSALFEFQRNGLATILSAIALAGFDARITKGAIESNAALHVVVTKDGQWNDQAKELLERDSPLLWLPASPISGDALETLAAFGITSMPAPDDPAGELFKQINYNGQAIEWSTGASAGRKIAAIPEQGEALASANGIALILRNGNRAMLNGPTLAPEAAIAVADAIAAITERPRRLDAPFNGYGVVGTRSAFFATAATELRVTLVHDDGVPFDDGEPIRVIKFSRFGNPDGRENVEYRAPFTETMSPHELLIVEAVPASTGGP